MWNLYSNWGRICKINKYIDVILYVVLTKRKDKARQGDGGREMDIEILDSWPEAH